MASATQLHVGVSPQLSMKIKMASPSGSTTAVANALGKTSGGAAGAGAGAGGGAGAGAGAGASTAGTHDGPSATPTSAAAPAAASGEKKEPERTAASGALKHKRNETALEAKLRASKAEMEKQLYGRSDGPSADDHFLYQFSLKQIRNLSYDELGKIWLHYNARGKRFDQMESRELQALALGVQDRMFKMFYDKIEEDNPGMAADKVQKEAEAAMWTTLSGKTKEDKDRFLKRQILNLLDVNKDGSLSRIELMSNWTRMAATLFVTKDSYKVTSSACAIC